MLVINSLTIRHGLVGILKWFLLGLVIGPSVLLLIGFSEACNSWPLNDGLGAEFGVAVLISLPDSG